MKHRYFAFLLVCITGLGILACTDYPVETPPPTDTEVSFDDFGRRMMTEVVNPLAERVMAFTPEDVARLEGLVHMGESALADHEKDELANDDMLRLSLEMSIILESVIPADILDRLSTLVGEWLRANPQFFEMDPEQQRVLLEKSLGLFVDGNEFVVDCEGKCTATALLTITAIESSWVGAMIGCAALTLGYPICVTAATITKYAALAATGVSLSSCLDTCKLMVA
jgi:hypothetical protein